MFHYTHRLIRFVATLIFLVTFPHPSTAQTHTEAQKNKISFLNNYVSRVWTTNNGLPANNITDMIQSKDGYLYFGTYVGLVRFDGINFEQINHSVKSQFAFVSARSILQDARGNIWVGTNDEGVACIHPDESVVMYTTEDGLPNNSIRDLTEDYNGNIWVGTASGLAYITPQNALIIPSGLDAFDEENIHVQCLYCDTAGRVWITSLRPGSVYIYADNAFTQYKGITSFTNPTVDYVTQDSFGVFWFGIAPGYAVRHDNTGETVYNISHGKQNSTIVNCIFQDSKGNMWFALDNGIAILHNGEMIYYNHDNGLADNNVNIIKEDTEGNIWIGADRGGVEKLTLSKFRTIQTTTAINAIAPDSYHKVTWLGSDSGLLCYDLSHDTFITNEITRFCENIRIRHVELTKDANLLISTYNNLGQIYYTIDPNSTTDSITGTITSWTPKEGLAGNKVRVCIETSNQDLYVGTTLGLSIIDHKTGAIRSLHVDDGIPNEYIMCLFENDDGTIWAGTDGGGIFVLENGKVSCTFNTENGLAGNVVFKIEKLEDNNIWVCTGKGISRFSNDGYITNFTSSSGVAIGGAFQIITDYTGKMWFTSNQGISATSYTEMEQYAIGSRKHITTKLYGQSDGLRTGGVTPTSLSAKDAEGRIWFTLSDGFAIYDPLKVTNQSVPQVQIQGISIDNENKDFSSQKIIIPPSGKRINIHFSSLTYTAPEQIQFRYRLLGFEKEYSEWTNQREVSYTNLKHGSYVFEIMAQNADEITSTESLQLTIIKKPYIWQYWWAQLLAVIMLSGLIALFLLHRYHQMIRYQEKLEHEVALKTEELQQKSYALMDANINLAEAKEKSENLLLNILPRTIATELTEHPDRQIAKQYPNACVLFADLVGFTKLSDGLSATEVVNILNSLFTLFDKQLDDYNVEKIKTIGDAYMAATGLTEESHHTPTVQMIHYARQMLRLVDQFNKENNLKLQLRIGINCGTLVAGVIGKKKFIYDIWGDTVNVASRMESTGIPGRIHVTQATWEQTNKTFTYDEGVQTEVKGKGSMKTYFISQSAD